MSTFTKFLAGGVAIAALASAAPASAQYYPGYGNPGYGYGGGNVVGQVLNQVLGGGYGGYGGNSGYGNAYGGYGNYGANSQMGVNQCAAAVQQRLSGGYGNAYGGGRVLGISRVEPRSNGGLTVRGVAASGRYAGAYGTNGQAPVDLTWKCKVDYRGYVSDINVDRAQGNYGANYGNSPYSNNGYDYSQYGYRRY
jgi:hypothetical protein